MNQGGFHKSNMVFFLPDHMETREVEFLKKLAEAYTNYDSSVIEEYLADDMHYASMWVFHEMTSKEEYLDYLSGKLETMKNAGSNFNFRIVDGRQHEKGLMVDDQAGFVVDFDDNGKVKMLNITYRAFF